MNILDMWLKAVSHTLCYLPCTDCHKVTGTTDCPNDIDIKMDDLYGFIRRVTELIRSRQDEFEDVPFGPWEISEDEFIEILKECSHD